MFLFAYCFGFPILKQISWYNLIPFPAVLPGNSGVSSLPAGGWSCYCDHIRFGRWPKNPTKKRLVQSSEIFGLFLGRFRRRRELWVLKYRWRRSRRRGRRIKRRIKRRITRRRKRRRKELRIFKYKWRRRRQRSEGGTQGYSNICTFPTQIKVLGKSEGWHRNRN